MELRRSVWLVVIQTTPRLGVQGQGFSPVFSFFVVWCLLGVVFQVISLPLAAAIGLHNQLTLASTVAGALAAYFVFLS